MAWWRRNGSRKRDTNGTGSSNGTSVAARIEAEQLAVATVFGSGASDAGTTTEPAVATVTAPPELEPFPAPAEPEIEAAADPEPAAAEPEPEPAAEDEPADPDLVPAGPVRRHAAEHLARSRATAVHALSIVDVDLERVERVRAGAGLDVGAFLARAVADALARHPRLNASVEDDGLRVHRDVHLAITVDLDDGMVAPVVRGADGKRLRALATELDGLRARAAARELGPDDLAGATFTIAEPETEPGLVSIPIIHQPQVAILALGGTRRRPVAVPLPDGGEAIAVHPVAPLALVWDHRAVDRTYSSAFLASVRDTLEARDWQAEL